MPPWCWEAELWKMEIVAFRVRCMVRYRVWSVRTVALTSRYFYYFNRRYTCYLLGLS
jgi:hypothetical protein